MFRRECVCCGVGERCERCWRREWREREEASRTSETVRGRPQGERSTILTQRRKEGRKEGRAALVVPQAHTSSLRVSIRPLPSCHSLISPLMLQQWRVTEREREREESSAHAHAAPLHSAGRITGERSDGREGRREKQRDSERVCVRERQAVALIGSDDTQHARNVSQGR